MAYTKEYNNNSKDLTQRINIEKKFADYIYKEFRAINLSKGRVAEKNRRNQCELNLLRS